MGAGATQQPKLHEDGDPVGVTNIFPHDRVPLPLQLDVHGVPLYQDSSEDERAHGKPAPIV